MMRFMGLMPSSAVTICKTYEDSCGSSVVIQAGGDGWTVLCLNEVIDWEDKTQSDTENFKEAYETATRTLGTLVEKSNSTPDSDPDNFTLGTPSFILPGSNANFDGDILNAIVVMNKANEESSKDPETVEPHEVSDDLVESVSDELIQKNLTAYKELSE